jgi:NAD(P)H-dependent FMN reductase
MAQPQARDVRTLLIVHHTPSPALQSLLEAVIAGTRADGIEGVETVVRPALAATAIDVLAADGFVLGTPANIGYMSGALKHFFDQVYYPCLTAKVGAPYGLYVHGGNDTVGAVRAAESIASGLGWQRVHAPVEVVGTPTRADTDAAFDLGATVAATLVG